MSGFEEIPTHSEQVLNLTVDCQQTLSLGNRFETTNLTFLLTSVLMRDARLLETTFVGAVWVSSRIYRVGILSYGKKPSLKEMVKWIKYA